MGKANRIPPCTGMTRESSGAAVQRVISIGALYRVRDATPSAILRKSRPRGQARQERRQGRLRRQFRKSALTPVRIFHNDLRYITHFVTVLT
jgi:hypothetical protein